MNQKGFLNIILIVVIVAIITIVAYFSFSKKSMAPIETQTKQSAQQTPQSPQQSNQGQKITPPPTNQTKTKASPTVKPEWFTYQNQKPQYSIQYLRDFGLRKYGNEKISIGGPSITLENNARTIAILIDPLPGDPGPAFEQWAKDQAMLLCDSDGPNSSSHCDKITNISQFKTSNSNVGYEIYMNLVNETYNEPTTNFTVGPVFVFDVTPKSDQPREGLMIHSPLQKMNSANVDIIRSIIATLAF